MAPGARRVRAGFFSHSRNGALLLDQNVSGAGANLSLTARPLCSPTTQQLAANCPAFDVKQRILSHEYEELVEDEHSKKGHMDLIFRQGKEVGLSVDDILNAEPLPTTRAAMYAWFWIARTRPWQEAIAASTIAEWTNDDRLLGDIGGGNCSRLYNIWTRDLNFTAAQVPNFTAHSKADVKHSDMFIDVLEKYVLPGREQDVLTTAKESMDIHRVYFGGMAQAMERTS